MDNINIDSLSNEYYSFDWSKHKHTQGKLLNTIKKEYENLFWNMFDKLKIEQYVKAYTNENKAIPYNELSPILADFREHFPKGKRKSSLKGLYFDDRIETCLKDFESTLNSPIKFSILNIEFEVAERKNKLTEARTTSKNSIRKGSELRIGTNHLASKPLRTYEDHFKELTEVRSLNVLKSVIKAFGETYGENPNKRAYEEALNDINQLILEAQQIPLSEAFNKPTNRQPAKDQSDYIKLTNGYYENIFNHLRQNGAKPPFLSLFDGNSAYVYAKYVLFKEWLENQISPPSNRAFLAFCTWLDVTGIMEQEEKTKAKFIEGIFDRYKLCQRFNLDKVPERVIKQFRIDTPEKKDIEEAKEKLIPLLPETEQQTVINYLKG